jgi:transposase InsO family protein
MKHLPTPSHREQVALFRLGIIGDLLALDLARGELAAELQARSERRYRPPGQTRTRRYHWKTLQRWYYAAKSDGAAALEPDSRTRGRALQLTGPQREVLLAIRGEHPSASAELILEEAVTHGVVAAGAVSLATLRRLFREAGLPRRSLRRADRGDDQRRRWRTCKPGLLWQGDVCHLLLHPDESVRRFYIHAFMDDHSRYVVALMALEQEREVDMLEAFFGALLKHPKPHAVYLDNGACYSGELFALICKRLDIRLVHAEPHAPKARGLQERFWRTLRTRCLDYLPATATLHDVNQALWAFLDADYHRRPHAGLFGATPRKSYFDALPGAEPPLSPARLAEAVETTLTRHVRGDATFTVDTVLYEVTGRHLLGKEVNVVVDGLTGRVLRVTHRGKPVPFGLCRPADNAERKRPAKPPKDCPKTVTFTPIATLLQKARELNHD